MLLNKTKPVITHVEFVSYSGKYPHLCTGILTLKIDGEEVKFGDAYNDSTVKYRRFWRPCPGAMSVKETGQWGIDVKELPAYFRKYAEEIDIVFNENVEQGHCGGCR